ncbi:MAG: 6-phosphogluconolactonase [Chryseolinea sp.]
MTLHIYKTVPEVIVAIADYIVIVTQESIATRGECNIVLSGGSSPELLYKMLASSQYRKQLDWSRINFFFGDERNVPNDDAQNNANMVRRTLFDPLNISSSRIFPVNTSLPPDEAAKNYSEQIVKHFKGKEVIFDLILLGLGDNSHTASLFPHTPILHDQSVSVQSVFLKEQNVYRISMTASMINLARHIAFLVYGRGKAEAVHHVLEDESNIEEYPAQLINPMQGIVKWFVDEAAASQLKPK